MVVTEVIIVNVMVAAEDTEVIIGDAGADMLAVETVDEDGGNEVSSAVEGKGNNDWIFAGFVLCYVFYLLRPLIPGKHATRK